MIVIVSDLGYLVLVLDGVDGTAQMAECGNQQDDPGHG